MLSNSKVYSFIDNKDGFALYFFEGQKLIHDLAIIHNLKGEGFHFLRDSILGSQLISVFLKPKENFGFYIDSDTPYFRFKIETNYNGYMRTLLIPEEFNEFPEKITGVYRVSKIIEGGTEPYNTVIDVKDKRLEEIINQFFKESFQINGKIFLSENSDQSIFLLKLPEQNVDKVEHAIDPVSLDDYWNKNKDFINQIFEKAYNEQGPIEKKFTEKGLLFLGSKDIQFKCSCSRERMVMGILGLMRSSSREEVFLGKPSLETKCDYCKTFYEITADEVTKMLEDI